MKKKKKCAGIDEFSQLYDIKCRTSRFSRPKLQGQMQTLMSKNKTYLKTTNPTTDAVPTPILRHQTVLIRTNIKVHPKTREPFSNLTNYLICPISPPNIVTRFPRPLTPLPFPPSTPIALSLISRLSISSTLSR